MLLTSRQIDILRFIRDYMEEHSLAPTLAEIANHFGVSKITVHEHLAHLECKGAIRRSKGRARSIEILWDPDSPDADLKKPQICRALPIAGQIAAGAPIEAVEEIEEFRLSDLMPPHTDVFLLRVKGNSMIGDHICDGDLVIVEPRKVARNGETVVALVNGNEATLKKYYNEKGRIRLQPANPAMKPIYPEKVEIQGVVIGVVRKF